MKTAMQLAIEHYEDLSLNGSNQAYVVAKFLKDNFLEIEKQQIIDFSENYAFECVTCRYDGELFTEKEAKEYYKEKFNI